MCLLTVCKRSLSTEPQESCIHIVAQKRDSSGPKKKEKKKKRYKSFVLNKLTLFLADVLSLDHWELLKLVSVLSVYSIWIVNIHSKSTVA